MTDVLEAVDFELIVESFEESEKQCESTLHMVDWRMPAHPGHWYASAPCKNLLVVCDDRRRKCLRDGSWRCTAIRGGCEGSHEFDDIEWTPVS